MAEIDKTFQGLPFEEGLANWGPVQAILGEAIRPMEARAKAKLAAHRSSGDSFIEVEHADVDYHLILNDTRGQKAAMSIEFGRGPDENGAGATEGLWILHEATGLPHKSTSPRSHRRKRYVKLKNRRRRRR